MSLHKMIVPWVLAMLFGFQGCTHMTNLERDHQTALNASPTEDVYSREMARLDQIVRKKPNSIQAKKAHLRLAELYLNHNNFRRNYLKAHEHMQAYIRLEKGRLDESTHNWIAALREIDLLSQEIDSRNRQIAKLQGRLEKAEKEKAAINHSKRAMQKKEAELRETNGRLEASNQKLQQTIEMLKRLDKRLEEKRQHLNN